MIDSVWEAHGIIDQLKCYEITSMANITVFLTMIDVSIGMMVVFSSFQARKPKPEWDNNFTDTQYDGECDEIFLIILSHSALT